MTRQRWRLLHNVIRTLEPLMTALGLLWMVLLIVEFTRGLTSAPGRRIASAPAL